MNRDRRVLQFFELASQLPANELDSFLDSACSGDANLRVEIESLLAALVESEDFLPEGPGLDASTDAVAEDETIRPLVPATELLLEHGVVLNGRYTIVETIGSGGMGEVYRATDSRLDRDVAIKVLSVANLRDSGMQYRFTREMKSIAALSHPNIMTLHDITEHGNMMYAVMELITGQTLRQIISAGIDWQAAIKLAHGIAAGLNAAHSQNIMHRDIKPENVILTGEGQAKILDFGLARHEILPAGQELTATSLTPGTVPYMSPEQAESKELTCSTDIFSLGTVLFEMLTGANPFRADSAFQTMKKVSEARPPAMTEFVSGLPTGLISLVKSMLQIQPELRPTAAEVANHLGLLLQALSDSYVVTDDVKFRDDSAILNPTSVPTNLPKRRIELIGRSAEQDDISSRFDDHSIVTVVGPGGAGKTSVGLSVAWSVLPRFPGGVWFCELASVRESAALVDVVGGVLDGNAGSISGLDDMVARLQGLPTLLIFDNCEHVVDAAAELTESLTQQVSNLTILATSREPLDVHGESVHRLEGLPFEGTNSSAAELFVKRASSLTKYEDTPERRHVVEKIVAQLEGLPLAIELAAPQLVVMSLEELLEALDDQLATLHTRRRSHSRQATLDQTISWSFDLLTSDEQQILLALSVFTAPFTSKAARAVCNLPSSGSRQLHRLVEQSVVMRTEYKGRSRYRLLEPIRQFCESRIDLKTLSAAEEHHAYFFAARAAVLGKGIYGENEIETADALNIEWPDLRKAITWGREHSVIEVAIDPIVAMALTIMFQVRVEAFQWMIEAAQQFDAAATSRADVNYVIAMGMWMKGDHEQAVAYLDRADSLETTSQILYMKYTMLFAQNRFSEALEAVEQARQIAHAKDDELECRWLSNALVASSLTMVDSADPRIDKSLATATDQITNLDWPTGNAYLLMIKGTVAMTRGDLLSATQYLSQAATLSTSCGNRAITSLVEMMADGFTDPSVPAIQRLESAVGNLCFMLEEGIETGEVTHYPLAVRSIITAMVECQQLEAAARCSAIVPSLQGVGQANELSPRYQPTINTLAQTLGQDEFQRLQHEGASLTVFDIAKLGEQLMQSMTSDANE